MLKWVFSLLPILCVAFLVGCQFHEIENMVLLDEKIAEVTISESNGFGGMNEEIIQSFTDKESIKTFKKAITTARKQVGNVDVSDPQYDVMVKYTSKEGQLPTHGIHLWLGKENEKSMFMYIEDKEVYFTSSKMTEKLRMLILSDN
ncbi:hypothetical protein [Lederbergia lenta]|uniref:hypothetical protein n=1 Tax=Lederbergia lenta TaxID=1467 RepID=UPI00203D38DA|nr:hypothetical protein [Lederbergia lenta]MCM3110746.1 hypothetical protein [Lederbergia lenta]